MKTRTNIVGAIWFVLKTIILFCFVYDFIFFLLPTPLLSSRKIAYAIIVVYFLAKGYSVKPFLKNKNYSGILLLCLFCLIYVIILNISIHGNGINAIGTYVFFILYSVFGVFLFAGFFNWDFDKLLKALAIVTVFQATWCILTYYIWDVRLLNEVLFVIDKDENVDFLSEKRLRSIGGAGSALSVCIALSSFSFLYYIVKGEKIALNVFLYFYCSFAVLLTGTTGLIVSIVSLTLLSFSSVKNGKRGFGFVILTSIAIVLLFYVLGFVLDADQFRRLTERLVGFYEDGLENGTFENLKYQTVTGISEQTLMGTGLFRGRSEGAICFHDSGYIRNYFALGLIMAIVFYLLLYFAMLRMTRKTKQYFSLLLIFLLIVMVIEYKEPYLFYYYPFFIYNSLVLAAKNVRL